jgi:transposase
MNWSPHTWKEARRLHAWELLPRGWSQRQIAEAMGVSEAAASQWMKRAREQGSAALQHRSPPGVPRRLSADQLARWPALWPRGAEAYGFCGQVWTRARVAVGIHLECGVWCHPAQVSRLLNAIRWSLQTPERRARPRDEAAMAHWHQDTWPAITKGPRLFSTPSSS